MESIEKKIVAAALRSRNAYDKIIGSTDANTSYTPYASQMLQLAGEYYDRDGDAKGTDRDVLSVWIEERITPKNQELYKAYLYDVCALDVSAINLADMVVDVKKRAIGNELAAVLLNEKDNASKIKGLMEKYDNLNSLETIDEEESLVFNNVPITKMVEAEANQEGIVRLLPASLDRAVKGRARRQHHLCIYARPETGKTAETLTMLTGFALQKLPSVYFGNEDPIEDIMNRARSSITGMTYEEILAYPDKAQALLDKRGWEYLTFIPLSPGTPAEIERYIKKLKPACVMLDQLRNIQVGQETRVNQLEIAATTMRNFGKKYNCLMVSITQAGDSASNKLVLDMGDVDYSNTGIPAQMDLMVGIGVNKEYDEQGIRMFATPKNKIGGTHGYWQTRINPTISRYEDM